MQEPTELAKTSTQILNASAIQSIDPRSIILVVHQATGEEQALDFWVYQNGNLEHYHAARKQDSVSFAFARNYLGKNHELFDEIYLTGGQFIHIKKFIEPTVDLKANQLNITLHHKQYAGPQLTHESLEILAQELCRQEIYTTDLCSIDLLDAKIVSRKIIRKYFGEIGLKYYKRSKLCGQRKIIDASMQRLAQSRRRTDIYPFINELNQIPITKLIEAKFTDEIGHADNLEKFLYDRYYYSLINDAESQLLTAIIHMLADSAEELAEQFTPDFWTDAVDHVRFLQHEFNAISEEEQLINAEAYNFYRARYIVEKLGSRKIKHFLDNFFALSKLSQNVCTFSEQLSELLGENIDNLFQKTELRELDTENPYGEIMRYPVIVRPPKTQIQKILHNIEHISTEQMNDHNLLTIAYFFANFWYISSEKSSKRNIFPSDALYAATRIVRLSPQNSKAAQYAIFYAGDILNSIQNHLPERELNYQKYLFDLFWPYLQKRVDFVKNYLHTEFSNAPQEAIINNALDWILYLPDLNQINPELHQYLLEIGQLDATVAIRKNTYDLYQGARCSYIRTLPAKARLAELQKGSEELLQLYYSDSLLLSDAKIIIPYLLSNSCKIDDRCGFLEDLASSHKNAKIFDFSVRYVADHLPALIRNFQNDLNPSGQYWALRIFMAFCDGAKDLENIEPLEYLASKLSAALVTSGRPREFDSYLAKINLAFSGALKHIENSCYVCAHTHFVGLN